jgi:uncharacterized protein
MARIQPRRADGDRPYQRSARPESRRSAGGTHSRQGHRQLLPAAAVVQGTALALLVAWDGSPVWRAARVLMVAAVTAAAVWALDRGAQWLRGVTALVMGTGGVCAGIGIGAAHLFKAGLSATAAMGLVIGVTGLILLGAGAVMLTRLAHRWWRLLALPAGLAWVALVISPLVLAVYAVNVPPTDAGTVTPASRGLAYTDVAFRAADGVRLSGWYVPSGNGGAVVLLHGAGSTRAGVLNHAAVLARHGYGVLLFDSRGHGRSGGDAMEFGWYGDRDIRAAVSFLEHRPDVHAGRIAVAGMSMGGEEAIGAAASDSRIRAVVAEGATGRVAGDASWLSQEYGWRGWIQERITGLTSLAASLLTSAPRPIALRASVAEAAPRPVLLIAAGKVRDEIVAGRFIRRASPGTVQLWIVPGAAHTGGLATHPAEWTERVTGFLGRALHIPGS